MSKYNHYARDLDRAFTEARKTFFDARKNVQRAEADYERAVHWNGQEDYPGQKERHIFMAKADLEEAREMLRTVNSTVWAKLDSRKKELTAALQKDLDADGLADPGAVDGSALELMRSGVMSAADYHSFAERYADNRTMRRLVAHYAQEAAGKAQDLREHASFAQAAQICADSTMQNWETLCGIMARCAGGRPGRRGDPDFVAGMAAHWEDLAQSIIEGF